MPKVPTDIQRYLFSFDNAPVGIVWHDDRGKIIHVNAYAAQKLEYTPEELKGNYLYKFVVLDTQSKAHRYYKEVSILGNYHLFTRTGQILPVEVLVLGAGPEEGDFRCAFFTDISETIHLSERLQSLSQTAGEAGPSPLQDPEFQHCFRDFIGKSPAIGELFTHICRVAPTPTTVLIHGETGTGKELVVEKIHQLSGRAASPLIKINCATLPAHLVEDELFGHEKGAFTGAHARKPGRFELADGGTLFLDEIGELPLELQSKLLRVLQDGEFQRLGGVNTIKTDVRIITATNRDLQTLVARGDFRADLYFRLSIFPVTVPPLKERLDDIPLLVDHFAKNLCRQLGRDPKTIAPDVIHTLKSYHWPGNVRELQNVVERACILSTDDTLTLPATLNFALAAHDEKPSGTGFPTFEENERRYIIRVLKATSGKVFGDDGAAAIMGINPRTLTSKIKKLGIHKDAL